MNYPLAPCSARARVIDATDTAYTDGYLGGNAYAGTAAFQNITVSKARSRSRRSVSPIASTRALAAAGAASPPLWPGRTSARDLG
ncbi:hypothetical protein GCM10020218_091770 [Dactylosporangium vinaceum]